MNTKATLIILALALLPLASAATYNVGDSFTIEGAQFNITGVSSNGDAAFFANEYGNFAIRSDDCIDRDIYVLCVENISDDIVEHYPHRYEIIFEWEKLCSECLAWGKTCTNETADLCENACVHGTCQPKNPWCGDTYCDQAETYASCPADCPQFPENETQEPENQSQTIQNPDQYENVTQESQRQQEQQQAAEQQDQQAAEEQAGQEPTPQPDGPAAQIAQQGNDWLVGGLIIFGGLVAIFAIFHNKNKKKEDLYSYRK